MLNNAEAPKAPELSVSLIHFDLMVKWCLIGYLSMAFPLLQKQWDILIVVCTFVFIAHPAYG